MRASRKGEWESTHTKLNRTVNTAPRLRRTTQRQQLRPLCVGVAVCWPVHRNAARQSLGVFLAPSAVCSPLRDSAAALYPLRDSAAALYCRLAGDSWLAQVPLRKLLRAFLFKIGVKKPVAVAQWPWRSGGVGRRK